MCEQNQTNQTENNNQANAEQKQQTTTAAPAQQAKESKWNKAAKYVGFGIGAAALGAASFFGVKYYMEHKS